MAISSVVLGTSETTIKQAGASEGIAVTSIQFCNTTASDRIITLYAYASGGSAGDSTTIIKELTVPAKDTFIWTGDEKIILETSGVISGLCDSASSVTATINYKTLG